MLLLPPPQAAQRSPTKGSTQEQLLLTVHISSTHSRDVAAVAAEDLGWLSRRRRGVVEEPDEVERVAGDQHRLIARRVDGVDVRACSMYRAAAGVSRASEYASTYASKPVSSQQPAASRLIAQRAATAAVSAAAREDGVVFVAPSEFGAQIPRTAQPYDPTRHNTTHAAGHSALYVGCIRVAAGSICPKPVFV